MIKKIILFVFAGLILLISIANARERDPLIKLLIKKGVITKEEVLEMEAEIIKEKSNSSVGLTPDATIKRSNWPDENTSINDAGLSEANSLTLSNKNKNNQKSDEAIELLQYDMSSLQEEINSLKSRKSLIPEPVKIGFSNLKIGGLLQLWYMHDETSGNIEGKADTFQLRRSEIMFRGKILPEIAWTVMIDPSKELRLISDTIDQETRILQDFHFELNYIPHHSINVGQFLLPLTEEGLRSSVKLDTIERSFIGRTFGNQRDIGIQLRGTWKYVDYWMGIFNGSGQNRLDVNDNKDVAGRIVLKPFTGLEIGMSALTGKAGTTKSDRNRLGGEIRYKYNDFTFKGEYMKAKDSKLKREGWYAQIGYYIPFLPKLQGVFKYEEFEDADNNEKRDMTVGFNYFLENDYVKLQINYINRNESKREIDNDQILTAFQIAF
ncbi:MAG: porin [Planctomycetota bacterium]